jgi:hypothetical protein
MATIETDIQGFKVCITVEQLIDFSGKDLGYIAYCNKAESQGSILGYIIKNSDNQILTLI